MQTKETKQSRFANAQHRANKRDRKADLDPETNSRDRRVLDHRAACPIRNKLLSRMLGQDMVEDANEADEVIDLISYEEAPADCEMRGERGSSTDAPDDDPDERPLGYGYGGTFDLQEARGSFGMGFRVFTPSGV